MKQIEYFNNINVIREKIKKNLITDLDNRLKEMYAIKPVRLLWFVAQAELMLKQKLSLEEVYKILESKGWQIYDYNGIEEYSLLYLRVAMEYNDIYDVNRNRKICAELNIKNMFNISRRLYIEFETNIKAFINDFHSKENWNKLYLSYYQISNYLMHEIVGVYGIRKGYLDTGVQFINSMPNMGYIKNVMYSEELSDLIIVATNENDYYDCIVLVKVFVDMGKKVYFIDLPMAVEVESMIDISDTLEISIENLEFHEGVAIIHSVEINYRGNCIGDNREYIIDFICKEYTKNNFATIFCSGKLMDKLCQRPLLQKQMERLSAFQADYLEDKMAFGWVGSYTSYISKIYDFDTEAEINKPSEYQFSIVIPARNSAESLRYTLMTCLNQRYQGSYEIVLSDNSTNGNTQVYDLYCELNDPRIHYYKTPRDLHLPKSFEFAFLKAKGEFVLSIGSDDALLPWTLEVLADVLERHPNEEIFQWERGFYAWPGFNGGQENEFLIPGKYEKGIYELYPVDKNEYLAKILNDPKSMFSLPMLYINSGFRRSYLHTLLDKTGRLWDGICQDIYIGVINISINDSIMNIKYPLTIAGMTGASVGAQSNIGATSVEESNNRVFEAVKTSNVGGFAKSAIERLMPEVTADISSLYNSILRAIARGVLPMEFLENLLDWKQMFTECFRQLEITDVLFDKKLHYFRYTAAKHGDDFLKWFDETIYSKAIIPREIDYNKIKEILNRKTYKEGPIETGGEILDASKYGVSNVYEAALLFEKITKL